MPQKGVTFGGVGAADIAAAGGVTSAAVFTEANRVLESAGNNRTAKETKIYSTDDGIGAYFTSIATFGLYLSTTTTTNNILILGGGTGIFSIQRNTTVTSPAISGLAAVLLTGATLTGQGTTNTKPSMLIEPTGTTSTGWSNSGTIYGANAPSGFVGNLFDGKVAGATMFSVNYQGDFVSTGGASFGGTQTIGTATAGNSAFSFNTRSQIRSPADGQVSLRNAANSAYADLLALGLQIVGTITPAGTTGNATIDKSCGSVNFATAAASLTLTNSRITTSSVIKLQLATNDTTCTGFKYTPGNGSIVIRTIGAPAAEVRCDFEVINPL